ncbi:hypothetical protein P4S95_07955 [Aneurinibacillus aneurinilyticus]|uniref:hypothetical protein n=1 Tax=Aneurinibacillus aneurinilyticus TaxID=1391 RepID=UPI002E1B72EE|nr:hypothetical protein [Aneurinibacillus aneurinilyticus]
MEIRCSIELAVNEDDSTKDTYNEIDIMIVKATEHEFDWNNAGLLKAYNRIEKFELLPRRRSKLDSFHMD